MSNTRSVLIGVGLILVGQLSAAAQDVSRYRDYVFGSSVDSVVAASGGRSDSVKTLHERPATIRELEWRAPYVSSTAKLVDPVREIAFTFYNDALYRIVVYYDRDRTEGLTSKEIIDAISATYGEPALASASTRASSQEEGFPDSTVLARWNSAESRVTLMRGAYIPTFQMILVSPSLDTRARAAIKEAVRLDTLEAPRREAERRQQEANDTAAARDEKRDTNKAAFRP